MIDAAPSLEAAAGLTGKQVATYLAEKGWTARSSKMHGVSIFSKLIRGAERPVDLVLPLQEGFPDERRRVADALRVLAQVERRSEAEVASQINNDVSGEQRKVAGADDELEADFAAIQEVETLSDAKIEERAAFLRKKLGLLDEPAFNVADVLQKKLSAVIDDFRLEIFADADETNLLAYYRSAPPRIFVREEIFNRAYKGDPWARYTLAHEIGHMYLLSRWHNLSNDQWQPLYARRPSFWTMRFETSAHRFAMAFLMPGHLLQGMNDPYQVSQQFNVSLPIAEERMQAIRPHGLQADLLHNFQRLLGRFGKFRTRA